MAQPIYFQLSDVLTNPLTGSKCILQPLISPYFVGNVGTSNMPIVSYSDTTGSVYFSNVVDGLYKFSYSQAGANTIGSTASYYRQPTFTEVFLNVQNVNTASYVNGWQFQFGTGSYPIVYNTASYALQALSASYAPGSPSISSSYSFFAVTASYAENGGSGGPSISSSWASQSLSASYAPQQPVISSSYSVSASWSPKQLPDVTDSEGVVMVNVQLSCNEISSNNGDNYMDAGAGNLFNSGDDVLLSWPNKQLLGGTWSGTINNSLTSSIATSSSFAVTASYALNGSSGNQVSCSWASQSLSASYAPQQNQVSSSYALTASYALNGGSGGPYQPSASLHFAEMQCTSSVQSIEQAFTQVTNMYPVTDDEGNFNQSTQKYTVPQSGIYYILTKLRYADNSTANISYALGCDIALQDSSNIQWQQTWQAAAGPTTRNGANNTRISYFTSGSQLMFVSYWDTTSSTGQVAGTDWIIYMLN